MAEATEPSQGHMSAVGLTRSDGKQKRPTMAGTAPSSEIPPGASIHAHSVLTVLEVAAELRCSKAHVHHLITGSVPGIRPLPSLWLGRRRLVLRTSFEEWLKANERHPGGML